MYFILIKPKFMFVPLLVEHSQSNLLIKIGQWLDLITLLSEVTS